MASVNKVILIGNLGKDPETRYTQSGDAVSNFSIATSEKWKDKSGEKQESTEWHNITLWGRLAELASEYLRKGDTVYIEGKLKTRQYEKEGVTHYRTEVHGLSMQFVKTRGKEESAEPRNKTAEKSKPAQGDLDDDIPF